MSKGVFISFEWLEYDECILTLTRRRKRWLLFGPIVETVESYRGESTVWHHYPSGRRCGTFTEGFLCNLWQREVWKIEDERASPA